MFTRHEAFRRHAAYYVTFLEQIEPCLLGPEQADLLEQIEQEYPQLCRMLDWTLEAEAEIALRLTGSLRTFWEIRGYLREGREWLQRALAVADSSCSRKPLLKALIAAGNLANLQGDYAVARAFQQQSLELATEPRDISVCLNNLGLIAWRQGEYADARHYFERGLVIDRKAGNTADIAMVLNNLGVLASDQKDYPAARIYLEEGLLLAERADNHALIAILLNGLGVIAQMQNDLEEALEHHHRSLVIKRDMRNPHGAANSLHNIGLILFLQGDHATSKMRQIEALKIRADLRDQLGLIESLEGLAHLTLNEDFTERAVILCGCAARWRIEIGTPIPAVDEEGYKECLSKAREKLTLEAYQHAWQEGQTMEASQAVALALDMENELGNSCL